MSGLKKSLLSSLAANKTSRTLSRLFGDSTVGLTETELQERDFAKRGIPFERITGVTKQIGQPDITIVAVRSPEKIVFSELYVGDEGKQNTLKSGPK